MIPSSCERVSVHNPNLVDFLRFALVYTIASNCFQPCSACVAQHI